jgi:hypothetical protein
VKIRKNESHQKERKKERGAHSNENKKLSGKNLTFNIKETLKVILSKCIKKKKKELYNKVCSGIHKKKC